MRLRVLPGAAAVLLAGPLLSACFVGGGLPLVRDTLVETRAFEPGGQFTLENVNGRVTVATWSEPKVRIEAEKAASSDSRLKGLRVEIVGEGRQVDVRTRMPGGWLFGGGGQVEYRITLPADARVRVETLPEGAGGRLEARTVNGSVENDLPLESTDRSTRRRLEGRLGKGRGLLELSTVNGSIHLRRS